MIINAAKYSCAAGHGINEDSCLCSAEKGIFIVADGLGGHSSGEKASLAAVDYFERNCTGGYTEKRITELMEGANTEVIEKGDGGKTTVAAAFTENGNFIYANAGDSRVYYFREGRIIAQTKDHSVCQASADMGMIRQEDIRGSEDRSRLLKVLGGDEKLNIKKHYAPIKIQDGDAFLLCSDGFWDYVYETEMEADLLKSESSEVWLKHMLKRHILRAENKGDNYTAICGIIYLDGSETYIPPTAEIKAPEVKTPEVMTSEVSNKNNTRLIAIAAVGVLLIAAAIALAVFLNGNDSRDVISEITETTPVSETPAEISEPGTEENEIETSSEAVSDTDISQSETENETISETTEAISETTEAISETTDAISETSTGETEISTEAVSDTDISESETEDETPSETTGTISETNPEEAETNSEAASDTDISEPEAENETISETSEDERENITEEKTSDEIENDLP